MASHIQIEIKQLSKERYVHLNRYNESYDDNIHDYTIEFPEIIDELADKILELINSYEKSLEFEFILDELTKLGQAPCLLYDDDGHFAITGDCISSVNVDTPSDMELGFNVKKEQWFPTIREALRNYLND